MTFAIRTDRQLIRAGASSARYVMVSGIAPDAPERSERLPVNVALILDRSGSMDGAKFVLARQAVELSLRMLRAEDRFALVVYDEEVDVLMQSTRATPDARRRAMEALRSVGPRGATDMCGGWMRGCEQIAEHLRDEGVARALLVTDGLANRGVIEHDALRRHASELRQRGIATSTFGVGSDFEEKLLRDMAHEGGGNFYFIETPTQIPDFLTSELGEALDVVARHAALEIVLPRGARAEVISRYRVSQHVGANELRVELGDLVSGQEIRAVVRVQFAPGRVAEQATVRVAMMADAEAMEREDGFVTWTYATHAENDHQPRDREVDREVATLYAARAREQATEANRRGDFDGARRVLELTADRIQSYAAGDPALVQLAWDLRNHVAEFGHTLMSPVQLKRHVQESNAMQRHRDALGKARRHQQDETHPSR